MTINTAGKTAELAAMRIVVDAMGSDHHPHPDVEGSVCAAREYGIAITLVGDEKVVGPVLAACRPGDLPVSLVHAPEVLSMHAKGIEVVLKAKRRQPQTSIAVGVDILKRGEAQALVTAGNTGGAALTAYFRLGILPGVERPALAVTFPTRTGRCVVLDIGVNPDCKAEHLRQFAIMGSIYARCFYGLDRPRVGLLSNGEETGKGNQLVRQAYPLLAAAGLNFIGNVEAKEVLSGAADVVVTDGFSGNIFLKTGEAVAHLLVGLIREKIASASLTVKVGGLLVKPALQSLRRLLDPAEVGAALLLGVNGLVFIGHGRSDARAIKNAVRTAQQAVAAGILDAISAEIGSSRPVVQSAVPHFPVD